jgi:asparagine synthase (glutamine-hydrolysing)
MCGLTGGWSRKRFAALSEALPRMADSLYHRGPDHSGRWVDEHSGIALAHRRLAIVDLSPAGRQPMISESGRWVIAFNGEIYNHLELRRQLTDQSGARAWHGHSDTETLLAAFDAWGLVEAVRRCVGMFAFAVWDRKQERLSLARDRFGEKPLYYGWHEGIFWFGSELKALRQLTGKRIAIDRSALALYLQYKAVPAPYSIYQGVQKLVPGHCIHLSIAQLDNGSCPLPEPYWLASDAAAGGLANPFQGDEVDAADELDELLRRSIGGQMMADVPVGAFLSGGVDSSTVVAMMQAQSNRPVRTFSIGFHEHGYDEAKHAAAVARHLGTSHTELYLTAKQAQAVVPSLPCIYDEPFSDSSQIPTLLVSRLASSDVTVALTGDGGDEVLGGYERYFVAASLWRNLSMIPMPMRRLLGRVLATIPSSRWDELQRVMPMAIPKRLRTGSLGDKLKKHGNIVLAGNQMHFYSRLIRSWDPAAIMAAEFGSVEFGPPRNSPSNDLLDYMMLEDACHYLPDDILVKVDRAAMACSLETRVPMLDHRVFEFAWRLPQSFKIRGSQGKRVLRNVLSRYLPQILVDRPKMGFGVPINAWLRGPLKDWADQLLSVDRIQADGFFDPAPIRRKWEQHQSGAIDWQSHLWTILMFQAWLEAT